jgi:hypothetical protein
MIFRRRILAPLAVAAATLAATTALTFAASTAQAATTLCNGQSTAVAGGAYIVQNNEWNSSASECITTDGNADFAVANSSIYTSGGAPGGYPSIYKGCHWGACTSNSGLPVQVSAMTPGKVTTSWNTNQTYTGAYDVAYDIWYNHAPTTSGQPNAEEMMIWINRYGGVAPAGSVVASNVSIGGNTYTVWEGRLNNTWNDVSYVLNSGATSVSNLDVGLLAADSVSRGYMSNSDYLIDVEAGFEIWQGGTGLAANSYSVNIGSGGGGGGGGGGGSSTGAVHAVGAGKCLDVPGASTTAGTQLQIWDCNGTSNQTFTHTSSNQLSVYNGADCLDANGNGASPGTKVIIWPCNGQTNQQWNLNSNGTITGVQSGLCLDVAGASTADGAPVALWTCNGQSNQHWTLG